MEVICSSLVEWGSPWSTTEQSAISILRMARLWILVASEKSQNDRACWVGNQEKRRARYEAGTSARFGILTDASMVGERNDSSAHAYRRVWTSRRLAVAGRNFDNFPDADLNEAAAAADATR